MFSFRIGIFVPGLPTTVFLILASACYIRSSERLYNWLIKNKTFGKYIKDFREGKLEWARQDRIKNPEKYKKKVSDYHAKKGSFPIFAGIMSL